MVARRSKVSLALSQGINSVSSKEVKSNNFRTWNDVPVQLARNPPPRVIQVVSAPIATQMASRRVYPMTGIDVEDNAVVNNVVAVLYDIVAPKTGRFSTLNGLTTPLHCTPPMSNKPTLGFNIACAQNQLKRCQFNWGRKKNLQQGNGMQQYGMQRRDPKPSPVPHLVCYLCYYPHLCHT